MLYVPVSYVGLVFFGCIFHSQDLQTQITIVFGAQKTEMRINTWITRQVIDWCAGHFNGVLGTFQFNNESVRGVNYYQALDIDVQ